MLADTLLFLTERSAKVPKSISDTAYCQHELHLANFVVHMFLKTRVRKVGVLIGQG
jgi:hypothetical protein